MLVQRQVFSMPSFTTQSGKTLKDVRIGYETYGTLNAARDNAILICHYFAGTAHAAGKYEETDPLPGWWDGAIGPGKTFDTDRYFVICSDMLCCIPVFNGKVVTTGPATTNPDTGAPYSIDFPVIRYSDIVGVQKALIDSLGIQKLVATAGPSAGAVQALQWSVQYPDMVPRVISVIGPGLSMGAYGTIMGDLWARSIYTDPDWKGGRYAPKEQPIKGIIETTRQAAVAAMTEFTVMAQLGGLAAAEASKPPEDSILNNYLAVNTVDMMSKMNAGLCDANHFLYLIRAAQLFSIEDQIQHAKAKYLFIPVLTDTISLVSANERAVKAVREAGLRADMAVLNTPGGHLDGLTRLPEMKDTITAFLNAD